MGFGHTSTAHWLIRLGDLESITGLWVPSSSRSPGEEIVTFTANAQLTPSAISRRVERFQEAAQ
jgi:hypothetical protein